MLAKSLFALAASLALTSASPVQRRQGGGSCSAPKKPTLPQTNGESELDNPPEDQVLKYIALGHGIQNYTCTPGEPAVATGAVAVLYDATPFYPGQGQNGVATVQHFEALTTTTLWANGLPITSDGTTQFGASSSSPFPPGEDLELPGITMPFLGQHFFDTDGVPTFLTGESEADAEFLFKATKLGDALAPTNADPGPVGTGAVPWLHLGDNGDGRKLSLVYRVITAGGKPRECVDDANQSVPYTTYYWMYGPAS